MADIKVTDLTALTTPASNDIVHVVDVSDTTDDPSGSSKKVELSNLIKGISIPFTFALADETSSFSLGTKLTWRVPYACTVDEVRASVTTASTSGLPTFDINKGGTSILSTKLTIDANEKTSTTATTEAVISDSSLADDAEITFDVDNIGTGTTGPKITMYLTRT